MPMMELTVSQNADELIERECSGASVYSACTQLRADSTAQRVSARDRKWGSSFHIGEPDGVDRDR